MILVSSLEETFKEVDPNLCSHIFHLRWPRVYDPLLFSCRGADRGPLAGEDAYFYDQGQNVQKNILNIIILSLFVMETAENMQTYNGVAILKPIET